MNCMQVHTQGVCFPATSVACLHSSWRQSLCPEVAGTRSCDVYGLLVRLDVGRLGIGLGTMLADLQGKSATWRVANCARPFTYPCCWPYPCTQPRHHLALMLVAEEAHH